MPESLESAEILSRSTSARCSPARKYRGDFEARFKAFVAAVQARDNPIVFIDEIHTILGAGAAQGTTVDASSTCSSRCSSRASCACMGSTTYQEYRHFERDRALARRFQKVDVHEPSVGEAVKILQGLAPSYEEHHKVQNTREPALKACVELSPRAT